MGIQKIGVRELLKIPSSERSSKYQIKGIIKSFSYCNSTLFHEKKESIRIDAYLQEKNPFRLRKKFVKIEFPKMVLESNFSKIISAFQYSQNEKEEISLEGFYYPITMIFIPNSLKMGKLEESLGPHPLR